MTDLSREAIICQRIFNNGLQDKLTSIASLLSQSLGIQAQYINHALFNISTRLDPKYFHSFSELEQTSILAWGQRQTYHFYQNETWQDIVTFLAEQPLWPEKVLTEAGINLPLVSKKLEKFLDTKRTRQEVLDFFDDDSNTLFQWGALFLLHSRQGQLYHTWTSQNVRYVHWQKLNLSTPAPPLMELLLHRYFAFYGPATLADAAHFFGLKQSHLSKIPLNNLQTTTYQGKTYYFETYHEEARLPEIVVLGKFDPLLIAYANKDVLINKEKQAKVWKKAGQISAIILKNGQLAATWTFSNKKRDISFTVEVHDKLLKKDKKKIESVFTNYCRQMNKPLKSINYLE
ncbi:DNA glycosylase AlkZ-like family protein [Streptococcus hongkongensis]|nr:hypothetical protein NC01_01945 [Streptococcus uberis]